MVLALGPRFSGIAVLLLAFTGPLVGLARLSGADCNQNGIEDFTEISTGAARDCDGNGVPDSCDLQPVNHGLARRGDFATGNSPLGVLLLDIDGDGHRDLAVANNGSQQGVTLLWNDGAGDLLPRISAPIGEGSYAIAAADFGRGPLTDLVVANWEEIFILFQGPARRFSVTPIATDLNILALAAGDFDGDGDTDVAGIGYYGFQLFINSGTGDLTARVPIPIEAGEHLDLLALPIDGDAALDLVAAKATFGPVPAGSVSVFLNQGEARFAPAQNFAAGDSPTSVAAGDLDGDGNVDLVTANQPRVDLHNDGFNEPRIGDVSVLAGDGTGRFLETARLSVRSAAAHVALDDLDQDGDLDIVLLGQEMPPPPRWSRDSVISFFPNHGRGNISKAADFPVGITTSAFASGLATGDLTGDGFPEVVALDGRRSNLTILEKHPVAYGVDCNANSIPDTCELAGNDCNENAIPDDCDLASGAADCNRNTIPDSCEADCNQNHSPDDCDLASGTSRDCNLNGVPDDCDVRPSRIGFEVVSVGPPSIMPFRTILPADMDGDGDPDLVEIEEWGPVRILENRPGRSFELLAEIVLPSPGGSVAADDFEGDGDLDLAVALLQADLVAFFIQDGDHSFRAGPSRPVKAPATLTAGDFDRDGDADLALATIDSGDDSLVLLRNRGSGTFDSVRSPVQGVWPTTFAAHDLDDDGALDLTVRLQGVTGGVLWNDGQGSFREASTFGVPAWGFAVADLDGDSDLDAALGVGNGIISIVRNAGGRNFLTPTPETSGLLGSVIVAADFDLDRDVDLAASQLHDPTMGMDGGLELLPNGGNGSFVRRKEIASEGFITYILAVADFDEDGAPDLAVARTQNAYSKYELVFLFSFTSGQRSRDGNENQVPDECEGPLFHRGDLDGSGSLEVTDPIRGLRALFLGGEQPACAEAADANNDARIDITDMIDLLEYLFRGGPAPATPGPPPGACNQDPDPRGSPGDLGCAAYAGC